MIIQLYPEHKILENNKRFPHKQDNLLQLIKKLTNSLRAKQKEEVRMHAQAQYTGREATQLPGDEQDTTGPGQSPAQDVFFNVWRDHQGARQMHLSTSKMY